MKRNNVFACLRQKCSRSLPLLLAVWLVVPGCAGNRSDMFTSLLRPKADETELAEDEADPADADPTRIATKEREADEIQLTGLTIRERFRSMLGRDRSEFDSGDPFLDADDTVAKAVETKNEVESVAKTEGPTVDELLASFESKPQQPAATPGDKPWWESGRETKGTTTSVDRAAKAKFNDEFDSRLDRLRAELATVDTDEPETEPEDVNPFATASASADVPYAPTEAIGPSDRHPLASAESTAPLGNGKARVKAMLADARRDWENWNLRRAYQTALDAEELATLENLSFTPDEDDPREITDMIAEELRQNTVSTVSAQREVQSKFVESNEFPPKTEVQPKQPESKSYDPFEASRDLFGEGSIDPEREIAAASVPTPDRASSIGFPSFGSDGQWDDRNKSTEPKIGVSPFGNAPQSRASHSSGVSLLPPDDDFASEADGDTWAPERSDLGALSAPEASSSPFEDDNIRLTNHRSPGFTLSREQTPREQFPGLTAEDNRQLLTTTKQQRARVLEAEHVEFPKLPAPPSFANRPAHDRGPIRVAEAPRFALEDEPAEIQDLAIAEDFSAKPSLLGQLWRSQPIWFLGGLVLLIIALRLMPWPRHADE